ncbi:hypothetical protein [Paraburkholderia bryophila]|uniref:Uncharacterized protein n=1 Tax=Paraburkholderia bryophila TaxID=420952 RepID=A0A7Y9W3E4_9BURK|nr:hypothetical protein [Paraburkholderia bryophila]NYH13557.1 hypothetical protein [Paraburkholderia bryophila]
MTDFANWLGVEMTIDTARMSELMDVVEHAAAEIPKIYRVNHAPLDAEQRVLGHLRRAADALKTACGFAVDDEATYLSLEALRRQVVARLIDSARTCMALEQALLMAEARGKTLH